MNYYSDIEEKLNWITHVVALALSVIGAIFIYCSLVTQNEAETGQWISAAVYSASLILLYTASTGYHAVKPERWKRLLRIADHIAIYVKIAGTYTPFLMLVLPNNRGIKWLILLWGLVALGVLFKVFFINRFNILSTTLYLAMGWLAVFIFPELYSLLPPAILVCVVVGGLFFTTGIFFYLTRKIAFSHSIWHVFVMAGSGWHYASIYLLFSIK